MTRVRAGICVGLVWALITWPQSAAAFDPATRWRTLHTPHVRVHYDEGMYEQALAVGRSAEVALEALTERLGWAPSGPINIVLADETDGANGFAQNVPYNLVVLNAVAPEEVSELGDYDDWTYMLVAHELTHIVHIDTVLGIPSFINALFGRWLTPNGIQPTWIVEGLAVYFESALTGVGRAKSPYFDMFLRAAVLDDSVLGLGSVSGSPTSWPQGAIPYLYGGRFLDYVARRFGEDSLRQVSYDYGGRLFPFAVNASVRRAVDDDYPALYADFLGELGSRYRAQRDGVMRAGRREGALLTKRGQDIGVARAAADGALYFVETPVGDHSVLKVMRDGREQVVSRVQSGAQVAVYPGRREVWVAELEVYATYYNYGDLFRIDTDSGETTRLTYGARIHEPDISDDGRLVVFAQNDGAHSAVRVAPTENLQQVSTLADLGPGTQTWAPRFSPSGKEVVFVGFAGGQRDLYRVDLGNGSLSKLTNDAAMDGGPAFTRDGRFVVYHSDRDGIFNLYAVPAAGGAARRLTRVLGGAFQPEITRDGKRLVYRSYSSRGFDLAQLDLGDIEAAAEAEPAPPGHTPALDRLGVEAYPATPYQPWSTILPRGWLPVFGGDARGSTLGAAVFGQDAVGEHSYALQVWQGLTSKEVGFNAAYLNHQFHPGVFVVLDRALGFAAAPYLRNGRPVGVEEEFWLGQVGTDWPLITRRDWQLSLSTNYELALREPTAPLPIDPLDRTPVFPDEGRFAAARVTLSFSNARGYLRSISNEEGVRAHFSVRAEDPVVGSQYSAVSAFAAVNGYFENPWLSRQVLAASVTAGYGRSNYQHRKLFAIGGLPKRDVLLDLLSGVYGGGTALRGFGLAPYAGDALLEGHLEYRFPIWDVEAGVETLPLFVRVLHGAAFMDGAALANRPQGWHDHQHYSVGGELRADLLFAYGLPLTLRLGYGHGLGQDHVDAVFLVLGNVF